MLKVVVHIIGMLVIIQQKCEAAIRLQAWNCMPLQPTS